MDCIIALAYWNQMLQNYHFQKVASNTNFWCHFVLLSEEKIHSMGRRYFLNISITHIPLQKIFKWRDLKILKFFFSSRHACGLNLLRQYPRMLKLKWLSPLSHACDIRRAGARKQHIQQVTTSLHAAFGLVCSWISGNPWNCRIGMCENLRELMTLMVIICLKGMLHLRVWATVSTSWTD